jgi:hypothetical protein
MGNRIDQKREIEITKITLTKFRRIFAKIACKNECWFWATSQ